MACSVSSVAGHTFHNLHNFHSLSECQQCLYIYAMWHSWHTSRAWVVVLPTQNVKISEWHIVQILSGCKGKLAEIGHTSGWLFYICRPAGCCLKPSQWSGSTEEHRQPETTGDPRCTMGDNFSQYLLNCTATSINVLIDVWRWFSCFCVGVVAPPPTL